MFYSKKETKNQIYRTAMYLRLSREDGDKSESDSIANQRALINEYLKTQPNLCCVDEFVDDGYSGANFQRPAFSRMVEDLKSGAVNCIVLKDLSRFGRNYIEVGRYLEQIFPMLGVRVIAINDGYDSADKATSHDAIMLPIKNLMNDIYCRDISVKIKSQLDTKRKRGEFVGNFAMYGYIRDPKDRGKLLIDTYSSQIVRQIFSWKLNGINEQRIADRLNAMGVLSPLEYKKQQGVPISENFKKKEKALWSYQAISRILKNETYTGTMVQGKTRKADHRSGRVIPLSPDQWIRKENTHDAIVDKQCFELVQELMKMDTRSCVGQGMVGLFSGLIECADCHSPMIAKFNRVGDKEYRYYICGGYKKKRRCSTHIVSYKKVYDVILQTLQAQIFLTEDIKRLLDQSKKTPQRKIIFSVWEQQRSDFQDQLSYYKSIKEKLFEDYAEDLLTKAEYLEYSQLYATKTEQTEKAIRELDQKIRSSERSVSDHSWMNSFIKHRNITELDRRCVVEMIKKIQIDSLGGVHVTFRFEERLNEALKEISQEEQKYAQR